ncbi:hypothetical protein C8J57DRAFT_1472574, partial [Mycena rebaudengoi]
MCFFRTWEHLSLWDLSFLRTLLHFDYLASKGHILTQKLALLKQAPTQISIDVNPMPIALDEMENRVWKDLAVRVERSAGSLDVHWVEVREGTQPRGRLLRMRSEHGHINSELVAHAATLSEAPTKVSPRPSSAMIAELFLMDVLMGPLIWTSNYDGA